MSGAHLVPGFGDSLTTMAEDGFDISERIDMLLASDAPAAVGASIGLGVGFGAALGRIGPDLLLIAGNRFDMLAAVAALPFSIPVAHLHGGELSEGAIDDRTRHAITKLSHLHFVATEASASHDQMGEQPWRVMVSGAPALDNVASLPRLPRRQLEETLGLPLSPAPLLVTSGDARP